MAEGACGRSTDDASADRDELLLPVVIDDEFADRSGRPVNTRGASNAINTPCYGLLRPCLDPMGVNAKKICS